LININYKELTRIISVETGLAFSCQHGVRNGEQWFELTPVEYSKSNTFIIRVIIGWRHIEVLFVPGSFSSELLNLMRISSMESKALFKNILNFCQDEGASVFLKVNNKTFDFKDEGLWKEEWINLTFVFRVGQLNLNDDHENRVKNIITAWVSRMASAVLSLIPIEDDEYTNEKYSDGASISVKVNRYERDPRNRAAALSIHGYTCKGCGLLMSDKYGDIATGFIEVHHIVPVSEGGNNYLIDPSRDLLPLCPNCHSIIHRKTPPLTLKELKDILE